MSKIMRILTLGGLPAILGKLRRIQGGPDPWIAGDDAEGFSPNGTGVQYERRWTGSAWAAQGEGDVGGNVQDLAWLSDTDVWMTDGFYFAHWDGSAWTYDLILVAPIFFIGFAPASTTEVYLVSYNATNDQIDYYTWNGVGWSGPTTVTITHPGTPAPWDPRRAAIPPGGGDLLVGTVGQILNLSTATIDYSAPGATGPIDDFWLVDSSRGWAISRQDGGPAGGSTILENNLGWAAMASQPGTGAGDADYYYGIDGSTIFNIWAVGGKALGGGGSYRYLVQEWNGVSWIEHTVGPTTSEVRELLDVRVYSDVDVWVVGYYKSSGVFYLDAWHYDGVWTQRPLA